MSITVDIRGLVGLEGDFKRLSRGSQRKVLRQATMAGAKVGAKAIQSAAPVSDGDLRRGVRAAAGKRASETTAAAGVRFSGPGSRYWHFSEFGTSKQHAKPWIRPTWDSNEDEIAAAVRDRLASAIDEALSGR